MGMGADRPEPGAPRRANRPGSTGPDDDDFGDLGGPDALAILTEEVNRVSPLRPGEVETLIERVQRGEATAAERLLETHLRVVLTSATARQDRGLSLGDLFQEGSLGLFAAIGEFRGQTREEFDRFVADQIDICLEAAINEEEEAVKAERALIVAAADFDRVELMLARELRRKPTDLEIGTRLEWDAARTAEVREIVDEARRQHDAEILALLEPDEIDFLEPLDLPEMEGDEGHTPNRNGSLN